jgi:ribulose-phosphate 3-epimerase
MFEVIPSPGTFVKDWAEFEKKIELVRPFAKTIHVDVVDGIFAPNTTFADPEPFAKYAKDFILEVHLMVDEPVNHLHKWADAGFRRFIGHIEKMSDQPEFVAQAQLLGEVVLAIDKPTPIDAIQASFEDLDGLLVMLIQAGLSGQKFEEPLLEKVKQLREKTQLPIEVDGGINDKTIAIAAAAGVNRFVATSFLYNAESPEEQFKQLHESLVALETLV